LSKRLESFVSINSIQSHKKNAQEWRPKLARQLDKEDNQGLFLQAQAVHDQEIKEAEEKD
jgi:hypothetical protein